MTETSPRNWREQIEDRVFRTIAEARESVNAPVVAVAYSGGLDSTALLLAARAECDRRQTALTAIHVNHQISPNSQSWESHCVRTTGQLGITLEVTRVEIATRSAVSVEMAARTARQSVFSRSRADIVLLGHHADDLAETVLLNMMRGCGASGAEGLKYHRGLVRRPFIGLSRSLLERYVADFGAAWIIDSSNLDPDYSRNYVRLDVLPALTRRFPAARSTIGRYASNLALQHEAMSELACIDSGKAKACFPISWQRLADLSEARRVNVVMEALANAGRHVPSKLRLVEFLRQAARDPTNDSIAMNADHWALAIRNGRLTIEPNNWPEQNEVLR